MLFELALIISITDGDTVKFLDHRKIQHRVRLASIDAPERKQPYGAKSKQMLSRLIGNRRVTLDCPKTDRYKRLICNITYKSLDVNREMVRLGGAWVYRKYYSGSDYYSAEDEAKAAKRGLWKTSEFQAIPPWEWRKEKYRNK